MKLSDYHDEMKGWTAVKSPDTNTQPQIPNDQTQVNPYLRATLPLPLQYSGDTLRQYVRPGMSSFRTPPLPPSGIPSVNAAAQTIVAAAGSGGGATQAELVVPKEFTPQNQTVNLPGPLSLSWAAETAFEVFLSGEAGANGYFDIANTGGGTSIQPVLVSQMSRNDKEVAVFLGTSDGAGQFTVGPEWTSAGGTELGAYGSLNFLYQPVSGIATASAPALAVDWTGILAFFGASALPIVVRKEFTGVVTPVSGSYTLTAFPTTNQGNSIIVVINCSVNPTSGSLASITDTAGNTYYAIGDVNNYGIGGATRAIMYIAPNIVGGANTVTVHGGTLTGTGDILVTAYEVQNIQPLQLIPHFGALTSGYIPPINLASTANGGVTGVLPTADGGTGLSSPGTNGNALISNGTIWTSAAVPAVSSLNGETGAVVLGSAGNTILLTTPTANTINLEVNTGTLALGQFKRKVVSSTSYNQISADLGYALDVQTASPTTITLAAGTSTPTFVRNYGFTRSGSGSTTTTTLTGLTFTTGNVAVITVAWYNNITDAITITDSNSNTWHKVPNTFVQNPNTGAPYAGQQLWYSVITNGGAGITITATFPVNTNVPALYGAEFHNINTSSVVDQSASAQGNAKPQSPVITTTSAFSAVYGSVYNDSNSSTGAGSGWTLLQTAFNTYLNEYELLTSTTTLQADTNDTGTRQYTAAVVSLNGLTPSPLFYGWVQNNGSSTVTISPASGLINGAASIVLAAGNGCTIATDNVNYTAII